MSKLYVNKEPEGDRIPFLRGILVRSFVNVGLSFEDAYSLAQVVREELNSTPEVSSTELRDIAAVLLGKHHGKRLRKLYEAEIHDERKILVHTPTRSAPFSTGVLAHSLETCAISPELALLGAREVLVNLKKTGHREIDHKALRRLIHRGLTAHCAPEVADRYLSWRRFENSGIPLVILLGGTTGCGKSTIAAELAYRLNISRFQSTDLMREIIRSYLSAQMIPTLEYSSFEAWRGLPGAVDKGIPPIENRVVMGFLSQFRAMKPALNATVERAVSQNHHLILEGVHVLPTELDLDVHKEKAVIIPLMLASMKKDLLRKQLKRRGREINTPQAMRYIEHLDDIWELQSWLLSEQDTAGVSLLENWDIESTVRAGLDHVIGVLMKQFPPRADDTLWNA